MIVWIIAGGLSWGTFFGLMWLSILQIDAFGDGPGWVFWAALCLILGTLSGLCEGYTRQAIAKNQRFTMRGPSIVYTGSLEHGNTDEANEPTSATNS